MQLYNVAILPKHRLKRNSIFKLTQNEPSDPKGTENLSAISYIQIFISCVLLSSVTLHLNASSFIDAICD